MLWAGCRNSGRKSANLRLLLRPLFALDLLISMHKSTLDGTDQRIGQVDLQCVVVHLCKWSRFRRGCRVYSNLHKLRLRQRCRRVHSNFHMLAPDLAPACPSRAQQLLKVYNYGVAIGCGLRCTQWPRWRRTGRGVHSTRKREQLHAAEAASLSRVQLVLESARASA